MSNNTATANFALPIDPECLNDMSNAYAFWKHDVPPYLLGDKVTHITQDGFIVPEHYTGSAFKPVYGKYVNPVTKDTAANTQISAPPIAFLPLILIIAKARTKTKTIKPVNP